MSFVEKTILVERNNILSVNTCSKPTIVNGEVSPVTDTVDFGSDYTLTCNDGYTASSTEAMNCTSGGTLDVEHTCNSKPLITNTFTAVFIEIFAVKACSCE